MASFVWAHSEDQAVQGAADLEAIVASLERLSQMVLDFTELKELDINPFMVFEEGQGAAVVDARIFLV